MSTEPEVAENATAVEPAPAKPAKAKPAAPADGETVAEAPAEPETEAFPMALDEFCTRLSSTDRRVEMIGGFHAHELAADNISDLESAFAERFEKFCNAPA